MQNKKTPTVLYINSASRSGSTLVENALAAEIPGVACGEFYRMAKFFGGNARVIHERGSSNNCACGQPVRDCVFWTRVFELAELDPSTTAFSSRLSTIQRLVFRFCVGLGGSRFATLLACFIPAFKRELNVGRNCLRVYRAIAAETGASVILDSSKQIHQYYILKAAMPNEVKLVTLVRDGRAVVASMTRGERARVLVSKKNKCALNTHNADKRAEIIAIRAWTASVFRSIVAYAITRRSNRVFISYEMFCKHPAAEITRLKCDCSIDTSWKEDEFGLSMSHAIGGSPSRFVRGFSQIKDNKEWLTLQKFRSWHPVSIIGILLNNLLGYRCRNFVKHHE